MPINHDAATAIARMPFRHQVLVVGAELFGVGGTGRGGLAPDGGLADGERAIDDFGDGRAQRFLVHVAALDVAQLVDSDARLLAGDAFQSHIGADAE